MEPVIKQRLEEIHQTPPAESSHSELENLKSRQQIIETLRRKIHELESVAREMNLQRSRIVDSIIHLKTRIEVRDKQVKLWQKELDRLKK